jgi:predicted MFS family arabinose efflux permease
MTIKSTVMPAARTAGMFGWLDALCIQTCSFVVPALIIFWGVTRAKAGALSSAALLMSAVGAFLGQILPKCIGRIRTLHIAIIAVALFSLISGLTENFEQLFAARAFVGLALGICTAGMVLSGGWPVGWGTAALLYGVLFSTMPGEAAWRLLLWAGIAPAFMMFFIRHHMPEHSENTDRLSPSSIVIGTGIFGGYSAVSTWLPAFLRIEQGLSILSATAYMAVTIVASFLGYTAAGSLADTIGRRFTLLVFAFGSAATIVAYTFFPISRTAMLIAGFPLGFFISGNFNATWQRQGMTTNLVRGIGAIFPTIVGVLSNTVSLGQAIGITAVTAYALVAIAALRIE